MASTATTDTFAFVERLEDAERTESKVRAMATGLNEIAIVATKGDPRDFEQTLVSRIVRANAAITAVALGIAKLL